MDVIGPDSYFSRGKASDMHCLLRWLFTFLLDIFSFFQAGDPSNPTVRFVRLSACTTLEVDVKVLLSKNGSDSMMRDFRAAYDRHNMIEHGCTRPGVSEVKGSVERALSIFVFNRKQANKFTHCSLTPKFPRYWLHCEMRA